jgi:hypothetical protein
MLLEFDEVHGVMYLIGICSRCEQQEQLQTHLRRARLIPEVLFYYGEKFRTFSERLALLIKVNLART